MHENPMIMNCALSDDATLFFSLLIKNLFYSDLAVHMLTAVSFAISMTPL